MRHLALLLALALVTAACGSAARDEPAEQTSSTPAATTGSGPLSDLPEGTLPEGPSALDDMRDPELPEPEIDPASIIPGGPPPDGIPSIDDPTFVSVQEADAWLQPVEPVMAVEINGETKAYPVQILTWHEIVNDTVGGVPISVTYCPLCNTAVTFERVVNGVETTFGTSGRLYASALVMYDRATESLWTHFDGQAVVGVLTGAELELIPSPLLAWQDFKAGHPDAQVLSRETGFNRPYGTNPYEGYDDPETSPFLFRGSVDERAKAKQRVVGVTIEEEAKAWSLEAVSGGDAEATNTELAGESLVIFWKAGQASALEDTEVAGGRDVGSVAVFIPVADGQTLTFEVRDGRFVDQETGSTWDITGRAVEGQLAGTQLEQVHHLDTFWFAWSTYQPGTEFVEG